MKHEDNPANMFIYRFKHIKKDKIVDFFLFGCESNELFENDKLFKFWSKKFIIKGIGKRDFKITGWSLKTLLKRNNFFDIQSVVCS